MARDAAADTDRSLRAGRRIPYLLIIPGIAFLFVFFIVPLITLFKISLVDQARSAAPRVRVHLGVGQLQPGVHTLR